MNSTCAPSCDACDGACDQPEHGMHADDQDAIDARYKADFLYTRGLRALQWGVAATCERVLHGVRDLQEGAVAVMTAPAPALGLNVATTAAAERDFEDGGTQFLMEL